MTRVSRQHTSSRLGADVSLSNSMCLMIVVEAEAYQWRPVEETQQIAIRGAAATYSGRPARCGDLRSHGSKTPVSMLCRRCFPHVSL